MLPKPTLIFALTATKRGSGELGPIRGMMGGMRRSALLAVPMMAIAFVPARAWADVSAASQHFAEGKKAFNAGDGSQVIGSFGIGLSY